MTRGACPVRRSGLLGGGSGCRVAVLGFGSEDAGDVLTGEVGGPAYRGLGHGATGFDQLVDARVAFRPVGFGFCLAPAGLLGEFPQFIGWLHGVIVSHGGCICNVSPCNCDVQGASWVLRRV